uniref:RAB3A interacting protein like 1 n=1 Tax=Laticauda laticaudata TaxID=8630 RepID=A0A8C5WQX4_LATLA
MLFCMVIIPGLSTICRWKRNRENRLVEKKLDGISLPKNHDLISIFHIPTFYVGCTHFPHYPFLMKSARVLHSARFTCQHSARFTINKRLCASEAHKMVREANTKQAASEKQLREAQGKIDMLQAEVTALKTLVITSTPSSPNRELHPQLQSPTKTAFRKGHGRNKSTSSTGATTVAGQSAPQESVNSEFKEVDSILFAEFQAWKESPTLDKLCPFLKRIYQEDVGPCLDFTKHELSELVQAAVEQNTLTIEPVATQALPVVKVAAIECGGPKKCALSGLSRACKHRIKLGDSGNYYYISPSCRARITAVCNFFTYIRYIQQGLVRQDVELMYWEVMRLRKEMSIAKLGFYPSEM